MPDSVDRPAPLSTTTSPSATRSASSPMGSTVHGRACAVPTPPAASPSATSVTAPWCPRFAAGGTRQAAHRANRQVSPPPPGGIPTVPHIAEEVTVRMVGRMGLKRREWFSRVIKLRNVPREARPRECSIADTLDLVGERWSLLVIREISYGVRRFDGIVRHTGAPRDILTTRLRKLEAAGVIRREQYRDHPVRYEYHLTPAGAELFDVLLML